jgi:hypothetical protein
VRTNPNHTSRCAQAGQGYRLYGTDKWKDTALPRLGLLVNQDNWATQAQAKIAKDKLS